MVSDLSPGDGPSHERGKVTSPDVDPGNVASGSEKISSATAYLRWGSRRCCTSGWVTKTTPEPGEEPKSSNGLKGRTLLSASQPSWRGDRVRKL